MYWPMAPDAPVGLPEERHGFQEFSDMTTPALSTPVLSAMATSGRSGQSPRRISVARGTAKPATATSSAADLALARLVENRRRRNTYGSPDSESRSLVGDAVGQFGSLVNESLGGLGIPRKAVVATMILATVAVVSVAAFRSIPRPSDRLAIAGNVSFDGRPVQAVLEFHATTGSAAGGEPFSMRVESDLSGEFHRPATVGVPAGTYAVVVKSGQILPRPDAEVGQPIRIPARYTSVSSTPFRFDVTGQSPKLSLGLRR
ncbi:MAG: hypothetical protein EBZ59_00250 [Planctomycetia bacterium]|nr:hypothetical protein [Planctomycetia bacterium]